MATEKRLIDANEYKMALEKMMADACATHDWGYESILEDCIWELDAQTTVDAVEVVHGYWIEHKNAEIWGNRIISNYECSECHDWLRDDSDYCPNCGAKMDSE